MLDGDCFEVLFLFIKEYEDKNVVIIYGDFVDVFYFVIEFMGWL